MLRNDIKNVKQRINALNGEIDELNGGTAFNILNEISSFEGLQQYILHHKEEDDCFFSGIKKAVAKIEADVKTLELGANLLEEAKRGSPQVKLGARIFSIFYHRSEENEIEKQQKRLNFIKECLNKLEDKYNLMNQVINGVRTLLGFD